jgi:tRNA-dihydrouridine synthase
LENMNKWTWVQYCKSAAVVADRMGLSLTKFPDTVGKWYRAFREKRKIVLPLKKRITYHRYLSSIQMSVLH